MKLKKQVVSLELARRLKELGVKQESIFYWKDLWNGPSGGPHKLKYYMDVHVELTDFAAFSVAELGEMLPSFIFNGEDRKFLYCYADDLGYWRVIYAKWGHPGMAIEKERNEADARAKMLCFLIEQKIVEAK